MSATGLDVFDKTLQTTHIWLDELMAALSIDRRQAWKALSVVLQVLRDRAPPDLGAHLGAQLPLLVRGAYYDQYQPHRQPLRMDAADFLVEIDERLQRGRLALDPLGALEAVLRVLSRHLPEGQIRKLQDALPKDLQAIWGRAEASAAELAQRGAHSGDHGMKISELMSKAVRLAEPDMSLREAARAMREADVGCLPVREDDRLVGFVTDRDIAVRGVAQGFGPDAPIREVMSNEVLYCFEDQEVDEVCRNMGQNQIRRLPVMSRDKRLVGMLSLGDIAFNGEGRRAGEALSQISNPGGPHSQ